MIKFGKAGPFLACSGYPDCRFTSNFQRTEDGRLEIVAPQKPELEKVGECPRCGKDLVIKHARTGSRFIACTGYPDCNYTAPWPRAHVPALRRRPHGGKEHQARQAFLFLRPLPAM